MAANANADPAFALAPLSVPPADPAPHQPPAPAAATNDDSAGAMPDTQAFDVADLPPLPLSPVSAHSSLAHEASSPLPRSGTNSVNTEEGHDNDEDEDEDEDEDGEPVIYTTAPRSLSPTPPEPMPTSAAATTAASAHEHSVNDSAVQLTPAESSLASSSSAIPSPSVSINVRQPSTDVITSPSPAPMPRRESTASSLNAPAMPATASTSLIASPNPSATASPALSATNPPAFLRVDPAPSLLRPGTPTNGSAGSSPGHDARSVRSYRSNLTGVGDDDDAASVASSSAGTALLPAMSPAAISEGIATVASLTRSLDATRLRMLLALLPKLQAALPFRANASVHNLAVLVKAELRYLIWLKLLASLDARSGGPIADIPHAVVVPPLDVAFMWMVHLGDTKAYIQDVLRLGGDSMLAWQFPLERLFELHVALGGHDWVDLDSEKLWRRFAPAEPYKYEYPENMSNDSLPFVCPRCSTTVLIPAVHRCQRGGVNIALWSAMLFLNDVRKVAGEASLANFQLKSTQMAPNHVLDATLTQRFNTFLKAIRFDLQLQSKLRLSANRYWNDVYALLRSALSDSALSHIEQTHLTAALMNSYGNIVTELSVDLVERAEHWIRFLSMVETVTGSSSSSSSAASSDGNGNGTADPSDQAAAQLGLPADWLARCPDRYFKFLLLQGALCEQYAVKLNKLRAKGQSSGAHDDGPGPKLVMPTFDILIAYTTHVLTPNAYYTYSLAHFHRVINFHFYAEAAMVKAYTRTRKLWRKRYGEEYEEVPSGQSNLGSLLSKYRWRKLLKLGGKIVMLPLSLVVVSTVMLLGGGSSAASAATAVAPPSAGGAGGRRETEVTVRPRWRVWRGRPCRTVKGRGQEKPSGRGRLGWLPVQLHLDLKLNA
ncbi:hypothetical protein BCR44DRAFT_1483647 [Catenaria anguillulae PL171]|uniref:Uncharacterized protein n=1 Tax=Catenaria anguillulae PL171 TaxID=765915 RepID=A0A1Y2HTN7_9FUNG|nr:hypothetical protein BCR44DRAFT_1483647 [Catenaria anguillulae PL171]